MAMTRRIDWPSISAALNPVSASTEPE